MSTKGDLIWCDDDFGTGGKTYRVLDVVHRKTTIYLCVINDFSQKYSYAEYRFVPIEQ